MKLCTQADLKRTSSHVIILCINVDHAIYNERLQQFTFKAGQDKLILPFPDPMVAVIYHHVNSHDVRETF